MTTTFFDCENDSLSGMGALVGCVGALILFVLTAGVMMREFTQPSEHGVAATVTATSASSEDAHSSRLASNSL